MLPWANKRWQSTQCEACRTSQLCVGSVTPACWRDHPVPRYTWRCLERRTKTDNKQGIVFTLSCCSDRRTNNRMRTWPLPAAGWFMNPPAHYGSAEFLVTRHSAALKSQTSSQTPPGAHLLLCSDFIKLQMSWYLQLWDNETSGSNQHQGFFPHEWFIDEGKRTKHEIQQFTSTHMTPVQLCHSIYSLCYFRRARGAQVWHRWSTH